MTAAMPDYAPTAMKSMSVSIWERSSMDIFAGIIVGVITWAYLTVTFDNLSDFQIVVLSAFSAFLATLLIGALR